MVNYYVEEREPVSQHLNAVWWQSQCVLNDVETGWRDSALTHRLRNKEEVVTVVERDKTNKNKIV